MASLECAVGREEAEGQEKEKEKECACFEKEEETEIDVAASGRIEHKKKKEGRNSRKNESRMLLADCARRSFERIVPPITELLKRL